MRASRFYLVLSIASLVVAVGMGVAQDKCHRSDCRVFNDLAESVASDDSYDLAYEAFRERDFGTMAAHATKVIDSDDPAHGHALRAYALRGMGRHEEAIEQYRATMLLGPEQATPRLLADCFMGRAACYHAIGQVERAKEDIETAHMLTREIQLRHGDDGAHYQRACAYALESEMQTGREAITTRGKAIAQLKVAIAKGFDSWKHMRADLDLDALRQEPEFKNLFPKN